MTNYSGRQSSVVPNKPSMTAKQAGLVQCHRCAKLLKLSTRAGAHKARCPRCRSLVHVRLPNSLGRTWALVITSIILYVPANLLPMMTVSRLGHGESDTIMTGVMELIQANMWPLALVVFIASVLVPLLKMLGIIILLVSVQRGWNTSLRRRTAMFRLIELVGRWSMLDIFVITILVALVKLGGLATIEAGPGATAFASVVVVTMFAAISFDSRLIWDAAEKTDSSKP